jgi:hypothetical protein
MCTHVLNDFADKFKKFETLAGQTGNSKTKTWTQKLRWEFIMADEKHDLWVYVTAHVGSLSMKLLIEDLIVSFFLISRD